MITSDGNRNPANADRSTFGRAARGRRTRPASSARTDRHCRGSTDATDPPPESTKTSLAQYLRARARTRWPALADLTVRHRGRFAYVAGHLSDGTGIPLCRLRYTGYAHDWGFAIYRTSHDDYQNSILPSGLPTGSPEKALDTACGLYLNDPAAWTNPPTN